MAKKLPPSMMRFILPLIITFFITCLVSFVSVLRATGGLVEGFLGIWLSSWMIAWAVAYPTILVVIPIAKRLALLVVEAPPKKS